MRNTIALAVVALGMASACAVETGPDDQTNPEPSVSATETTGESSEALGGPSGCGEPFCWGFGWACTICDGNEYHCYYVPDACGCSPHCSPPAELAQ